MNETAAVICCAMAQFGYGLDAVTVVCDKTDRGHAMHAAAFDGRVYVWEGGEAAHEAGAVAEPIEVSR